MIHPVLGKQVGDWNFFVCSHESIVVMAAAQLLLTNWSSGLYDLCSK